MSIIQSVALAGASGQGGGGDLGDTVAQSLRFQNGQFLRWDSDTQSGDDRTQWTHSMWVKLAQVGVEDCLFSGFQDADNRFELTLRTNGQLEVTEWGAGSVKLIRLTDRLFRDHSAWYHLVVIYDNTNSTANDQLRLYVNGKRETSFSSITNNTWNGVFGEAGTDAVYGGKWNGSTITNGFDGYIALPIMLDGIIVSENADGYITEFGRLNGDGVWVPKDYTGSYGTNGWKLTLDSSQTNDIGEDSGNNNDFTDSGFDKNDIAIYSSGLFTLTDDPSQSNAYLTATGTNWSVGTPANFFDGAGTEVRTSDNAVLRFDPAIPNVTQVQTVTERLGTTNWFNGTSDTSSSVDNTFNTIYSGSAIDLTSIVFSGNATFGTNFKQIRVTTNGTQVELLDNVANDVDFNDTPTSNFNTFNPLFVTRNTSDGSLRPNVTRAANLINGDSTSSVAGLTIAKKPPGVDIYFEVDIAFASSASSPTWNEWWNLIILHDGPMDNFTWSGTTAPTEAVGGGFAFDFSANLYANNVDESQRMSNTSFANSIAGIKITDTTITVTRDGNSTNVTDLSFANNFDNGMYIVFQNPSTGANEDQKLNFGQMPYMHRPSALTDSNNLQTNNLPEPTIKDGRDHFDIITWSGNDASPRTLTGLEFQPDLVWTKRRNSNASHLLYDSLRGFGVDKHLHTDANVVEGSLAELNTDVGGFVSNNASSGFVTTAGSTDSLAINKSGNTYVAWCWKCDESFTPTVSGVSNASGKRNKTAGCSILTYTGNNTSGTITHGLDSAPEVILFKRRSVADNWVVYHASAGATKALTLDLADAEFNSTFLSNTAPSASTITLGGVSGANGTGTFVAYCWHSVEKYSKFGIFTGNNSADGPFIYTCFKPSLIIYKRTDQSGPWNMADSKRAPFNPSDNELFAQSIDAETSSSDQNVDILSNGFKLRNNSVNRNSGGGTYVYMAWAESPFGGENAPPATAR